MTRRPSWRSLAADRSGLAAVEFVMVAPFMLTLVFAAIELTNAFRIQAKVNTAAGQLAELIAGSQAVTAPAGSLTDMCTGAAMNLQPFSSGRFAADIVSGTNDHPSNRTPGSTDSTTVTPYLDWENISACPTQSPTTMGAYGAYNTANSTPYSMLTKTGAPASSLYDPNLGMGYSIIIVQASFVYSNILPFFLARSITFTATAVARPRQNSEIKCTNSAGTTTCPQLL